MAAGRTEPELAQETEHGPARYGFGGAIADAWDLFKEHLRICLGLFAVLHVAGALLAFMLLLAASAAGDFAAIPARLTAGVVIPVVAGSLAVAALSRHVLEGPLEEAPDRISLLRADVLGMTLVAALGAVAAVLLLGGYGILVLPFFYGPPVAMQIVVTEERSVSEGLHRARASLAGRWHALLYLFAVALVLGIVSIVPVGGLVSLAGDRDDLGTIAALSLGRGLLIGLFAGFLGAMQIAIFRRLMEPAPAPTDGAASQG